MASPRQVVHDFVEKTYKIKLFSLGEFSIVGIRGAVPDGDGDIIPSKNEFNKYDDTVGWIKSNERLFLRGTVEPGRKYTAAPMNPAGAFYLKEGLYLACRAKHFGKEAFNIYAKYPKGKLEGWRDTTRKGAPDKTKIHTDATGIDIHAGGNDMNNIDGWSAGCQVIFGDWNSTAWREFKEPLYKSKQNSFLYCLLNHSDIEKELLA
jgi:hypothetical protein